MSDHETEEDGRAIVLGERSLLAVIRFNRPVARNPLSLETLRELDQIISALVRRDDLTAIIFTGTNEVFASGANIRELLTLTPQTAKEFARFGQSLVQKIDDAPQLTVAAINGYCMGGGLDLALACDVRVASPNAIFAYPGARLGVITGWGGTQRLPRLIGTARALEMFTTAKRVTAHEAHEMGIVSRIGESALECAVGLVSARAVCDS